MAETRLVPHTRLWTEPQGSELVRDTIIVLECVCGGAVEYPGHPDEREETTCERCGRAYRAADPDEIASVTE